MELKDSPQQARFRAEVSKWLDVNPPGAPRSDRLEDRRSWLVGWHRRLHAAGLTGLSWPESVGGRGLGPIEEAIFTQECERRGVPTGLDYGFIGRAMLLFASSEQQAKFLPGLLSGEVLWCQGFSEPSAGSDLAGLRTRAVLDESGSSYRVTGHKIWTSHAQFAARCLCLVRTGSPESRHRGISALVIDMHLAGIDVRPIRSARGDEEFCEVFFDEVVVAAENLVGQAGQGWEYAMVTLTYERGPVDIGSVAKSREVLRRLWPRARSDQDRRALARASVAVEVLHQHTLRSLSERLDRPAGAEGSVDKLLLSCTQQALLHTAMEVVGGRALVDDAEGIFDEYLYSRAATIYGGTAQIQRNVIAERVLGLPK